MQPILPLRVWLAIGFVVVGLTSLGGGHLMAGDPLVHLVYRAVQQGQTPKDVAPIHVWRGGIRYLRVELPPVPPQEGQPARQQMILADSPHNWMLDVPSKTGHHFLDKDPQPSVHVPIFPLPNAPTLRKLEFGNEVGFFSALKAKQGKSAKVDGVMCLSFTAQADGWTLTLYVDQDKKTPYRLRADKGKERRAVLYDVYEVGGAVDPSLFTPPKEYQITDDAK
ncbi:MAG: hypothetical protein OEV94_07645 [Deltaproteobacteria bacterium]|nr:hypothetical protein [Deltaproteobacteria bacterium]